MLAEKGGEISVGELSGGNMYRGKCLAPLVCRLASIHRSLASTVAVALRLEFAICSRRARGVLNADIATGCIPRSENLHGTLKVKDQGHTLNVSLSVWVVFTLPIIHAWRLLLVQMRVSGTVLSVRLNRKTSPDCFPTQSQARSFVANDMLSDRPSTVEMNAPSHSPW